MIENPARRAFIKKNLTLLFGLQMYGCGGGGSGSSSTTSTPPATTTPPTVAPSFLIHPSDQTIRTGENTTFQALANGSEPLSYQWQRNGSSITGATGLSYTTPPVALGDDASFSVTATNNAGTTTSLDAQLTVIKHAITVDSATITSDSNLLTVDSA